MAVERVDHKGELLAMVFRGKEPVDGVEFITPDDFPLQIGFWGHERGEVKKPHIHRKWERTVKGTHEVIHVVEGVVAVDLYTEEGEELGEKILEGGDTILLVSGGHGFRILEKARVMEVKQGPYTGAADDKAVLE